MASSNRLVNQPATGVFIKIFETPLFPQVICDCQDVFLYTQLLTVLHLFSSTYWLKGIKKLRQMLP